MRYLMLLFVLSLPGSAAAVAQEDKPLDAADVKPTDANSYVVQLTEFRLKSTTDQKLTAPEIVQMFEQMKKEGTLDLIETIRLSALAGNESMVQFGKSVPVTVGATTIGGGRPAARQVQFREIGSMARLTATPQDGKVLLKLSYQASRLEGAGSEDQPQQTTLVQFNTTLLIESGIPTLVGGTSADASTYLLVSVQE